MRGWTTQGLAARSINLDRRRVPVRSSDRRPGPYAYYGASGVVDHVDDFLFEGLHLLVAEDGENLRSRKTPLAFLVDGQFWVNNHAHVLTANDDNDTRYLAYALGASDVSGYVTGSAQPKLTQAALASIPIFGPGREEQRGIAATLGALDDKIASNRRAANLIEELARTWFADWRERTNVVQTVTLGSYAEVFGGATPRTTEPQYWDGDLAWMTPTDVTRLTSPYLFSTSRTISDLGLNSCTAVMHPVGTIFMSSRATIGAFAVNQVAASANQGFIAVRPQRDADRWFLFEEMRSRVQEFLGNANGSTFLEISRGRFKDLPLTVPASEAIDELDRVLAPLHARASQLAHESIAIERLRDTLLPELLSGRIRVPEAREALG